jgi:MYXO-CTERM domain-containing protein
MVWGDETINQSEEQMGSLDWAVIAPGAAGGVVALLAVAAAVTRRRQRRSDLAKLTARGRTQHPERRIEVVAINDANPDPMAAPSKGSEKR